MHVSLRPGEKIYINGAVLRVNRKVAIELLNDVSFLLESHVMHAEDATTPLRQIYFVVQMMLIDPNGASAAREMFRKSCPLVIATFANAEVIAGLETAAELVEADRIFDALKTIRTLFPIEALILAHGQSAPVESRAA